MEKNNSLWVNFAPVTGRLILASKKFTNDLNQGEEYFGIPRGQNSRFELGASISAFYKFDLVENVVLEQRVNLYSDYLYKADNVDLDNEAGFDTASVGDDILDFTERNPFGEVDF